MFLDSAPKRRSKGYSNTGDHPAQWPSSKLPGRRGKTREMGSDSIENQGAPEELPLRNDENSSISSSMLDGLGRSRVRRSSIRNCNHVTVDAKNNGHDRKPAAKMLQHSTRGRNGVKSSVCYTIGNKFYLLL